MNSGNQTPILLHSLVTTPSNSRQRQKRGPLAGGQYYIFFSNFVVIILRNLILKWNVQLLFLLKIFSTLVYHTKHQNNISQLRQYFYEESCLFTYPSRISWKFPIYHLSCVNAELLQTLDLRENWLDNFWTKFPLKQIHKKWVTLDQVFSRCNSCSWLVIVFHNTYCPVLLYCSIVEYFESNMIQWNSIFKSALLS